MTKQLIAILLIVLTFGCSPNSENEKSAVYASEEMDIDSEDQSSSVSVERKLIKEGDVNFETSNISETRRIVLQSIKKHQGYASSDQENKYDERLSNTIVVRVPAKHFDALLQEATAGVVKFDRKEISVKDVTEEFLDVQARLKTKKELESRFLELLKKANSVSEILEIEKEIGALRSQIESIEGRLKYLQDQVSLSTLTISFYQKVPMVTEFGYKFQNGFKNGWNNLIWFFVFLTNLWPFIVIGIAIIFGIKYWKNKTDNKKKST